jgi:hypothetical protein
MEMKKGDAFLCIWYKSIFFFSCRRAGLVLVAGDE